MKHLLFLIVVASLYLHFYPNEKVTAFYNEQKQVLLDMFDEFSDTKVRLKSDKIYQDMESDLDAFSDNEIEQLKKITASRENVNAFYKGICQTKQRDYVFHIANEKKICKTISHYTNLL